MSFRARPIDSPTCAICDSDTERLVRFMLYVKTTTDGKSTTRGAGSILLCRQCWSAAKKDSHLHSRNGRSESRRAAA